jgi:hypothetical protein
LVAAAAAVVALVWAAAGPELSAAMMMAAAEAAQRYCVFDILSSPPAAPSQARDMPDDLRPFSAIVCGVLSICNAFVSFLK